MTKCTIFWGYEREHDCAFYSKDVELSFVPRVEDEVEIMGCSTVDVTGIEIDIDHDLVRVYLDCKSWFNSHRWEKIHDRFISDGWDYLYSDGNAPDMRHRPSPQVLDKEKCDD